MSISRPCQHNRSTPESLGEAGTIDMIASETSRPTDMEKTLPRKPAKRRPRGPLPREVRERIRAHYKALGLSQTKFAELVNVPHSTVTGWLSDNPPLPETGHLVSLATGSNVSIDHLLLGDEPRLRGEPQAAGHVRSEWRKALIAELLAKGGGGSAEDRVWMDRMVPGPDA